MAFGPERVRASELALRPSAKDLVPQLPPCGKLRLAPLSEEVTGREAWSNPVLGPPVEVSWSSDQHFREVLE